MFYLIEIILNPHSEVISIPIFQKDIFRLSLIFEKSDFVRFFKVIDEDRTTSPAQHGFNDEAWKKWVLTYPDDAFDKKPSILDVDKL